jgi:cysteine desulfurase/selenocysteine lyase
MSGLLDTAKIKPDFPILDREINGHRLVYLDSGNTSQKPRVVLDTMAEFYEQHNANVARSVHTLGTEATAAFEGARAKVAAFIGAATPDEIVFAKNSSEAINLVAYSYGQRLKAGDEIVISEMEHHSNIVPWQLLCERSGAVLRWFPLTEQGRLDLSALDTLVTERTKIVSITQMSNVLGTINPVAPIVARAHEVGAVVMLDASQSVPHLPVDVAALDVDFLAFTGHKMLGPTGIGVLWGRYALLDSMPPFLGGGSMIETVSMTGTTYKEAPARFEAGTPPIAQAVGLGAAVDYLSAIGMEAVAAHDQALAAYALGALRSQPDVRIFGPEQAVDRGGIISFAIDGVHPHDVGQILDAAGVQVRVGHHCARPLCVRYGVPAMTRASFYLYTSTEDIDALVEGLDQVRRVFR